MTRNHRLRRPGTARRILGTLVALIGTIVWTHALAGMFRAAAGIAVEQFAPAAFGLTLAAVVAALAGSAGYASRRRAAGIAALTGLAAVGLIATAAPGALMAAALAGAPAGPAVAGAPATLAALTVIAASAVILAGTAFAVIGAWMARSLPRTLDALPGRRPWLTVAWLLVALVAVAQIGRLSTYMTDRESDWFLSTREPFYAKHECANAYIYGAELDRRGEPNVYDAEHYPGLTRDAEPHTEMQGMTPEDPYQYAPQFLLWPRLAIEMTNDYGAIRLVWFGINVTLCLATVLLLALWVGGRVGTIAGLLSPAVLASFPVLHNFQYGQFHFATIALAILALLAFGRRRSAIGGALLAVSILGKLFPAVLVVMLAAQKRWRDLAWTAVAGAAMTLIALIVLGTSPFTAFVDYHLPRLADGDAFAFGDAWPELATLVTAGNQGIAGMVGKLEAIGVPGADGAVARTAGSVYSIVLFAMSILVGLRTRAARRSQRAVAWLGLLGLASLASTGAWADYVPLTCVWLLAWLAPLAAGRPVAMAALALCAVMQVFLVGTMPIGDWSPSEWLLPVSLLGAVAMLLTFGAAALGPDPVRASMRFTSRLANPFSRGGVLYDENRTA